MNHQADIRKKWIEAASRVVSNENERIKCPNCNEEYLTIQITYYPAHGKKDINLVCSNCGKENTVTVGC